MMNMKYAIACENKQVFQHFGKCPGFLLVDIEDGTIVAESVLDAAGSGHSALVTLLKNANVDTLVCGGIGGGARNALAQVQIGLIAGASGATDQIIDKLIKGTLCDDPSGVCNHHHEDGQAHTCGENHTCH